MELPGDYPFGLKFYYKILQLALKEKLKNETQEFFQHVETLQHVETFFTISVYLIADLHIERENGTIIEITIWELGSFLFNHFSSM